VEQEAQEALLLAELEHRERALAQRAALQAAQPVPRVEQEAREALLLAYLEHQERPALVQRAALQVAQVPPAAPAPRQDPALAPAQAAEAPHLLLRELQAQRAAVATAIPRRCQLKRRSCGVRRLRTGTC
jgi:hypothetical protein